MIRSKQKGFTLLELLVVITLLAVLSVGALIAYDGIGENASNVAAANNIKAADSAIRAFRVVENKYPNQWDNIANIGGESVGGAAAFRSDATNAFFGQWNFGATAAAFQQTVALALDSVGINEFQSLTTGATFAKTTAPNLAFNESAPGLLGGDPSDELEFVVEDGALSAVVYDGVAVAPYFAIVPSSSGGVTGDCQAGGQSLTQTFSGSTADENRALNLINDNLDDDGCNLVLALGFGKDAAGSTTGSSVAISTAPTYTNGAIVNPSQHYARYMALFLLGSDDNEDGNITADEINSKPTLLAVVDTEGRIIDQAIAAGYTSNNNN
ncbi:hypothetical protein MTYP_00409 [Methylophilaceae bacterium]|nr:hypothetical protein MTYP_00409 [Methylophilaceae bacterium]